MKKKIGTSLEPEVLKELKLVAAKTGKPISDVIEEALLNYFRTVGQEQEDRLAAVKRLCSSPFNLTVEDWNEIMEEDPYDQ